MKRSKQLHKNLTKKVLTDPKARAAFEAMKLEFEIIKKLNCPYDVHIKRKR